VSAAGRPAQAPGKAPSAGEQSCCGVCRRTCRGMRSRLSCRCRQHAHQQELRQAPGQWPVLGRPARAGVAAASRRASGKPDRQLPGSGDSRSPWWQVPRAHPITVTRRCRSH